MKTLEDIILTINDSIVHIPSGSIIYEKKQEAGMSAKERKAYNKKHGSNLKPSVSKSWASKSDKAAKRRKSFCSRMTGQKEMHNIDCRQTPDKKICKSLRDWDC
jgi:hypothetical protein